ncbi:preprotein translocase subunit SecG [Paracoccus sp. CPCC 101403]|uniref:Protein-export membrane protein SecG n=1 Tax=Paracoccus broussonetiae TaxID=3075834 RepID=A0ABU3EGW6_9RHOB|nr:preprotein translocase subunit SecG [Paracoccus sp. CPCC 101403]MDT1063336.1 preprotein translocase subunit SecG [Paracoccus sp. CPCC 101403]
MENVVLTVHLILAVLLIGVVLLQRSEGGGLGMGSGGGGGVMTGRQAANALSRATWILAGAFLVTSLTLTVVAARNASSGSIVDQLDLGGNDTSNNAPATNLPGIGDYTPPPPAAGQPVLPPVPGGATTTAPAETGTAAPATAPATTTEPVTPPAAPAPAPTTAPATEAPAQSAPAQTN